MRYARSTSRYVSLSLLALCLGLPAQTADESTSKNYRLRSRTRSAVVKRRVGKDHGLSGSIGEPVPGLQVGKTLALEQTDVFEPSTVQVVLAVEAGWNLLSLPFDHPGTVDGLFADEQGPLARDGRAMAWSPARLHYVPFREGFLAGEGFWLYSTDSARITLRGLRLSLRARPIQKGWNLIGRPWDGDDLTGLVGWDGLGYEDADSMAFGMGYWYYCPAAP